MSVPGDILRALEKHEEVREKRELLLSLLRHPEVLRARATPVGVEVTFREHAHDGLVKTAMRRLGKVPPDLVLKWSTDQQTRFLMDMAQ